jgi:hypothetical protein
MSVIEITTFRLAPGTGEPAFLDADYRVQTELVPRQPGFVRRTTARHEDGEWLVLQLWRTVADAEATAELARSHPAGSAFAALVDGDSVRVRRYSTLD